LNVEESKKPEKSPIVMDIEKRIMKEKKKRDKEKEKEREYREKEKQNRTPKTFVVYQKKG